MPISGHLFITHGDLLHLHCDAILIPSGLAGDRPGHLVTPWSSLGLTPDGGTFLPDPPTEQRRVVRVDPGSDTSPAIWAAHSGDTDKSADWYVEPYASFIRQAATMSPLMKPPLDRPTGLPRRLLFGVPLLGTGHGGKRYMRGEVVVAAVGALLDELKHVDVDIVLVNKDERLHCAAVAARTDYIRQHADDVGLTPSQIAAVQGLATKAHAGHLVLFIGAGVSIGAGLPSWSELLTRLASGSEFDDVELEDLLELDQRDAGAIIERRLGRDALQEAIKRAVTSDGDRVALMHQLMASLPVTETLTTNYDSLFERALADAGRKPAVLPRHIRSSSDDGEFDQWLVKLHGTVGEGEDATSPLVLSRADYLRFETSSPALAGVVQAMFLMRHLLFVGYSLSDDNFHRIVHQVHETIASGAYPTSDRSKFGTVLTNDASDLRQKMWEDDLEFVSTAEAVGDGPIRQMAMVLDALAAATTPQSRYLRDSSFDEMLSDDEMSLRDQIEALAGLAANGEFSESIQRSLADVLAVFDVEKP